MRGYFSSPEVVFSQLQVVYRLSLGKNGENICYEKVTSVVTIKNVCMLTLNPLKKTRILMTSKLVNRLFADEQYYIYITSMCYCIVLTISFEM